MRETVPFFDRHLETQPRAELKTLQWNRLQALTREVWATNPFWRAKWRSAGLAGPDDLASWDDFFRFPFMVKRELAEDQLAHPPFGTNLTYPIDRYVRLHQTSGTTGEPIRWLDTEEAWQWWARCWQFVFRGAGVTEADRVFFAFSFSLFIGFWSGFEGARQLGALAIPGGGQDSPTRLRWMETLGASALVCTPSYALHLADIAREREIDLHRLAVRRTIHAGEAGAGIPAIRRRIEEAWNAKCYDHAGMTEVGPYSFECIEQNGPHVIESEFIAEVLDPATGRHVDEGEIGELILTNLGRTGSPIFRYRTGDRVRWSTGPCECGRTFARLPGGILGRVDDMLIVRGINVFPSALEAVIRQFPAVEEFQIEAYKRGELDEIRLHLEVDGPSPEGMVRAVVEAVRLAVGIRVEAVAAPPKSLPRFELKAKRVVRRTDAS